MMSKSRFGFTLVELIVVIAIIGLLSSIAVTRIRGESPSVMMERVSAEFMSFCTKVRYRALEKGQDCAVVFNPETGVFSMKLVGGGAAAAASDFELPEDSTGELQNTETGPAGNPQFHLPEEFDFDADSLYNRNAADELAQSGDNTVEIFRFFPDGCASGSRSLVLQYKDIARSFHVSPLTGLVNWEESEGIL